MVFAAPGTAPPASAARGASIDLVILNYNYGRFVLDAVSSGLAQTRPFARIVVVDDGSTDDSLARLEPFAGRIRIVAKINGGQLDACFAGLAECAADYVWFLDADDYLAETAVEALTPALASRPVKAQVQLIGVDEGGKLRDSLFPVYRKDYGSAAMIVDNETAGYYVSAPTSGNVYARTFLTSLDPALMDLRDFVDGVPNLVAPYMGETVSLNLPLAFYRVHASSHSQWGRPSVAILEREIDMLVRRWREAAVLSGGRAHMPNVEATLYARERRLMIAALTASSGTATAARRFLVGLGASRLSAPMRLGLTLWAALLAIPLPGLRQRLVTARRSTGGRPRFVNKAIVVAKRLYAWRDGWLRPKPRNG